MKKTSILLLLLLLTLVPLSPQATAGLTTRSEVFAFLKDAYKAQFSLSEKGRTTSEVDAVLQPYFTERYKKLFLKANLAKENGKYLTYGSDFAPYYIPYYAFSEKTKVVILPARIYVFEYFPEKSEGPVGYKSHYEGLLLIKEGKQWKVDQSLNNNIPKEILHMTK